MVRDTFDTYKALEIAKRTDPVAFEMNVDDEGLPAGFVVADDMRREAAYQAACATVSERFPGKG